MTSRVLVVEDDELQRAVLASALERRGYEVAVAPDGLAAVRMLRTGGFDLALIDYQLPEIDGFASARLLRDMMSEEDRPKLIAVTAASDSLTSREASTGVFDAIVSKSLELHALLNVVDTQLRATTASQTTRAADATWREFGLAGAPVVTVVPPPTPVQAQLLRCYFDLSGRRDPEAVLLLGPDAADNAAIARTHSSHFLLPFVDLTSRLVDADAVFSATDRSTWGVVAAAITQFAERRQTLASSITGVAELEIRLLAYMFLSGRPFHPAPDFTSHDCVRYPGFFPSNGARLAAERLADRGLLERRFFERFHVCGGCGSSRLNAREECPGCHSAHLRDTPLVHHFRCAHQAPEEEFTRGPHLVCPKCRQHLRHYGSDYDKPGIATSCGSCGAISPEPSVGFSCLDCGTRTSGDAATKRDVFGYVLTAEGAALLRRGAARLVSHSPSTASLPEIIRQELARPGPVAALAELRYGARERIVARRGETGFDAMRRLFLENLVNALEGECVVAPGLAVDHLLIRNIRTEVLAALSPAFLDACQNVLAEGLEPELRFLELPAVMSSQ